MKSKKTTNRYKLAQGLADLTIGYIQSGDMLRVKKILAAAEELYIKGSSEIKHAIANVFVYSVGTCLEIHHYEVNHLLPSSLNQAFKQQINASGI